MRYFVLPALFALAACSGAKDEAAPGEESAVAEEKTAEAAALAEEAAAVAEEAATEEADAEEAAEEAPEEAVEEAAMDASCPVIDSRNWHAWVDKMPMVGEEPSMRLHVSGEVDLPTPGYEISWRLGIADRALPPGQRIHLDLAAPDGIVAQVVTPTEVKYVGPAAYPEYREIIVLCGDTALATLPDVMITE